MAIRIVPHRAELSGAVHAFNLRMRAGSSPWGFYVDAEPDWIPKRPGQSVWREYYVGMTVLLIFGYSEWKTMGFRNFPEAPNSGA